VETPWAFSEQVQPASFLQTLSQAVVVLPRLIAITRNRNQQQAAGAALGEGELRSDVLDRCLHRCELQPFFSITDSNASLSNLSIDLVSEGTERFLFWKSPVERLSTPNTAWAFVNLRARDFTSAQ
jgi:hypothetical protein